MAIKLSGMISGMDTESIISELVKAKSAKKDELKGDQKKLSWKQDAWKSLNTKIYGFYSKTLSGMRLTSDYNKKTTKSSNSAVSVITGGESPNCVQTMKINSMAKAGYLTGAQLGGGDKEYKSDTKLVEALGVKSGSGFTITVGDSSKEIKITESTTIGNVLTAMREAGVNANFDTVNQRFYISAKNTGKENDFTLTTNNADGLEAMSKLGIAASLDSDKNTKALYEEYSNALVYGVDGTVDDTASLEKIKASGFYDEALKKATENWKKILADAKEELEAKKTELDEAKKAFDDKYTEADGYLQVEKDGVNVPQTDVDAIQAVIDTESAVLDNAKTARDDLLNVKDGDGNVTGSRTYDDLSEDEKAEYDAYQTQIDEAQAKIDKYKEQKTAAADLKSKQEYIESQELILADAKKYYTEGVDGAEGGASEELKAMVAQEQLEKAKESKAMLDIYAANGSAGVNAIRIAGENASITLNGATYTAERNTFEINGLTITVNNYTNEEITLTTQEDTDGIYDMVKNFLKEYNTLINEMDKLYNAESAKNYDMLTDEERESISEDEAEEWDKKIKDSLLRRDSTLGTVFDAMKTIMLSGITMSDGSTIYLNEFGINTLGYFNAEEFEKNAYHIDGDPDDTNTANNTDKLKAAIAADPEKVSEFFSKLSKTLYEKLDDLMERTDYSSAFTVYNDKSLKEEYDKYTEKIADQEEKIANFEDRYYDKFTAMEVAMSKMQSQQSAVSSLFG